MTLCRKHWFQANRRSPIQVLTNPAVPGRESKSQPVDRESDAVTNTPKNYNLVKK